MNWSAANRGEVLVVGPMHYYKLMQMMVAPRKQTRFVFVAS